MVPVVRPPVGGKDPGGGFDTVTPPVASTESITVTVASTYVGGVGQPPSPDHSPEVSKELFPIAVPDFTS